MKTKNILGVLVLAAMLLGVMGTVSAVDQGVDVIVNPQTTVTITPTRLDFGSVSVNTQDNPAVNGPITFTAQPGANQNMTIEFTSVSPGSPFELMELEVDGVWVLITTKPTVNLLCTLSADLIPVCGYVATTVNARLDIPQAYPAGTYSGAITYTVTGENP